MAIFGAIETSNTGLQLHRKWMDAVSDNIANINTAVNGDANAFQERYIQAVAADYTDIGGGIKASYATFGSTQGRLVQDPTNPLANAAGYVRYPDIDLGQQMTYLIQAQRGYQANLAVVDRARDAYQSALQIGK